MTTDSSNTSPPFWNGEAERATPTPKAGGVMTLAEYAPPLLRPFARVLVGAVSGSGALSTVSIGILCGLGSVYLVGELAETRRDWFAGEASQAQAALFETQRIREEVATDLARATLQLTVEQESESIARREQAIWDSAKPLQEGWGDARLSAAYAAMERYRDLFEEARAGADRCREQGCASAELHRWSSRAAVFYRLFYTAVAFLQKAGVARDGDAVRLDEGSQRLTFPTRADELDLEWSPSTSKTGSEAVRPVSSR